MEPASSSTVAEGAEVSPAKGQRYLYAIVPGESKVRYGRIGIGGAEVYTIAVRDLAAVVSDAPSGRLRPERRHLAAHQSVLKSLAAVTDVLPISFGTLADSPEAIRRILRENRENMSKLLTRVGGKVEMGLRLTWDVPNIFEYFVNTHSELRAMRDQFFSRPGEPTQEEKLELGRLFDRLLAEDRDTLTETVEASLRPHCFEIERNKCRNEHDVMNIACLIGKDRQDEFEAAVLAAARKFDNNFAFDFNGPWPPYSFVAMEL